MLFVEILNTLKIDPVNMEVFGLYFSFLKPDLNRDKHRKITYYNPKTYCKLCFLQGLLQKFTGSIHRFVFIRTLKFKKAFT